MLMEELVQDLLKSISAFRSQVDLLVQGRLAHAKDCQEYFAGLLVFVAQLHVSALRVATLASRLEVPPAAAPTLLTPTKTNEMFYSDLDSALQALPWGDFVAAAPFSNLTGLRAAADYNDNLRLHLSDIYLECENLEHYARLMVTDPTSAASARLLVGLEHICYHHIGFAFLSLHWMARENAWPIEDDGPAAI